MELFDISVPIRPGMIVYEGDPDVALVRTAAIADGAICNVSRLEFGVHTGTHIDAPLHFLDGEPGTDTIPLERLVGPAYVVDATAIERDIDAGMLDQLIIPPGVTRLLFKTRNSELWSRDAFSNDFIGLTESAAITLVARGVRLVGADYLSVAPRFDPAPTHAVLLRAGVVILEGLDLRRVEPGQYRLMCLPLLIEGSDGAPARAVLLRE